MHVTEKNAPNFRYNADGCRQKRSSWVGLCWNVNMLGPLSLKERLKDPVI